MTQARAIRVLGLAALLAAGTAGGVAAQMTTVNPPDPPAPPPMRPGMMHPGLMQPGMMPPGAMRPGMMPDGMSPMGIPPYMLRALFAITDADADGAISFDEMVAIDKRVFAGMDDDKDGKVTPGELQAFMAP